MEPIVTPTEMAAIDADAPEPVAELIERAGWATARAAIDLLGRSLYGKRIAVLAGPGNNGADGRAAVRHLERRGARCSVYDIGRQRDTTEARTDFDLVVDACFGTGLRSDFDCRRLPIDVGDTPVLAVDIPSGVDGLTGELRSRPLRADATVTFAARKPGLLFGPGRSHAGEIRVADIGLDCSRATIHLVGPADVGRRWPRRSADDHKWRHAVRLVGGSPGMTGAPTLTATAALRAGAGYVALSVPGRDPHRSGRIGSVETVEYPVPDSWVADVLADVDRFGAAVVGPGLPVGAAAADEVVRYRAETTVPTVFDASALTALADGEAVWTRSSGPEHVLTPHDGEFARLDGEPPGPDRVAAARRLAERTGEVVLLKGPTTVVAHPDGSALVSTAGDARLATAGTGDVLAGVIAAGIAGGLEPFVAAGLGAELHGLAAATGHGSGLAAGDLPPLIAAWLSTVVAP